MGRACIEYSILDRAECGWPDDMEPELWWSARASVSNGRRLGCRHKRVQHQHLDHEPWQMSMQMKSCAESVRWVVALLLVIAAGVSWLLYRIPPSVGRLPGGFLLAIGA